MSLSRSRDHCLSLDGPWLLTYGPQGADAPLTPAAPLGEGWSTIDATVPGNVELDLLRAGKIQEPSVGTRVYALRGLENHDWWYRRSFSFPSTQLAPGQRAHLVFDGIDTLADVWLNGVHVGSPRNMLVSHSFDVTEVLRQDGSENDLAVRIQSAVLAGRRRSAPPLEQCQPMSYESLAVRKAPHMYGWDILPRLVSAGLWRGVRLETVNPTRWRSIYFCTRSADVERNRATCLLAWDFATDRFDIDRWTVRVRLTDGRGVKHESEHPAVSTQGRVTLDLHDVKYWWPRGYGNPHRYRLSVQLIDDAGHTIDEYRQQVGIRTVELRRTDVTSADQPGEFVFVVNGEKVFVKGTNWVPLDALHSRDAKHLNEVFDMLVDLNCNMVRCWGGNVYEDHAFYDLCDAHGVMVWQDFAMACAIYPQDDDFLARVRDEAEHVVTKFRNHASLVLWAGNNENDDVYLRMGLGIDPNTDKVSRELLPTVIRRFDPSRPYLPSSPYWSPELMRHLARGGRANELQPEQHLWGPRDDFKGKFYTKSAAHFVSEIGYHGCPDRASLALMMEPGFVWPWQDNEQWRAHQATPHPGVRCYDYRIPLMSKQIEYLFGEVPTSLDDFVFASQVCQAEALKFFIEWFRQAKWRRTGLLWWNLRDGWPVISDAIVDYYNRKKLAYEYVKRSQSDVCAIVTERESGAHQLMMVNDTRRSQLGQLTVRSVHDDRVLARHKYTIEPNSKSVVGSLPAPAEAVMWLLEWTGEPANPHNFNHYLAGPRPISLQTYGQWHAKLRQAVGERVPPPAGAGVIGHEQVCVLEGGPVI